MAAYPAVKDTVDKTFVFRWKIKIRTFNFKLIVMRYCCIYRWGTAQGLSIFHCNRCAFAFRMRVLLTTIFLVRLRRHFHSTEPLFEFPHAKVVFGIIKKPNKTINMMIFSFFIVEGKITKKIVVRQYLLKQI
jgi:hypothetical protein